MPKQLMTASSLLALRAELGTTRDNCAFCCCQSSCLLWLVHYLQQAAATAQSTVCMIPKHLVDSSDLQGW